MEKDRMFELLEELKRIHKDKQELTLLIKQAAEAKQRSIEEKEKLLDIMDMLIINRINMVEEMQFQEKRKRMPASVKINSSAGESGDSRLARDTSLYVHMGVSDLIRFFEDAAKTKVQCEGSEGSRKMPEETSNR